MPVVTNWQTISSQIHSLDWLLEPWPSLTINVAQFSRPWPVQSRLWLWGFGGRNSGADSFAFSGGFCVTPRSKRHGRFSRSQLIQRTEAQSVRGGSPRCGRQQFDWFLLVLRRSQRAAERLGRRRPSSRGNPGGWLREKSEAEWGMRGAKVHMWGEKKATVGWTEGGRKRVWWSEARMGKKNIWTDWRELILLKLTVEDRLLLISLEKFKDVQPDAVLQASWSTSKAQRLQTEG